MSALEEIGVEYEDRPLDLATGQHRIDEYLKVNPHGKIPALLFDGRLLTETAAILLFLDKTFPEATILPRNNDDLEAARVVSDIAWCSSGLHPVVRAIRMPMRWTDGDVEPVRERGKAMFEPMAAELAARFEEGPWWYGDQWSILDVYLYWNYDTARSGGFDLDRYPALSRHSARVRARPSFQRALCREREACERAAIRLPPGAEL